MTKMVRRGGFLKRDGTDIDHLVHFMHRPAPGGIVGFLEGKEGKGGKWGKWGRPKNKRK